MINRIVSSERTNNMKKIIFMIKQLIPFTYYSKYRIKNGEQKLTVWNQWLGKPFNIKTFNIVG